MEKFAASAINLRVKLTSTPDQITKLDIDNFINAGTINSPVSVFNFCIEAPTNEGYRELLNVGEKISPQATIITTLKTSQSTYQTLLNTFHLERVQKLLI